MTEAGGRRRAHREPSRTKAIGRLPVLGPSALAAVMAVAAVVASATARLGIVGGLVAFVVLAAALVIAYLSLRDLSRARIGQALALTGGPALLMLELVIASVRHAGLVLSGVLVATTGLSTLLAGIIAQSLRSPATQADDRTSPDRSRRAAHHGGRHSGRHR